MVRGRVVEAFGAHALGPILYLLFTASALACLYGFVAGRRFDTDGRGFQVALAGLMLVFFAYGVWRFLSVQYR
jgi:hypothetical protein